MSANPRANVESYRALFDEPITAGDPRYGGKYDRDDYDVYQLSKPDEFEQVPFDEFEQKPFDPSDPVYGNQQAGSVDVTDSVYDYPEGPYGTPIGPEWDGK